MATRLSLYNHALRNIGERKLASLTEDREPRYLLDDVWDNDGVKAVLELGYWNFAVRTVKAEFSPAIEPDFGYLRGFDKPIDFVQTVAVCEDEYFNTPLTAYQDEVEHWFSDLDIIYVRYVSDDTAYGGDLSKWTPSFERFASFYFAREIIPYFTMSETKKDEFEKDYDKAMRLAKSRDALNQPTAFPPTGSWVGSRLGGTIANRERGNKGSLIG